MVDVEATSATGFEPVRIEPGTYEGEIVGVRDRKKNGEQIVGKFGPMVVFDVRLNDETNAVLGKFYNKKISDKSDLGKLYLAQSGSTPIPGTRINLESTFIGKKFLCTVTDQDRTNTYRGKDEHFTVLSSRR